MGTFRDLIVYKKAFELALDIHNETKSFPAIEKYSLIDQIRRSSRSVCVNIAEGYRKRKYPKHWIAKLTDSDMENSETQVWSDFSIRFGYIDSEVHRNWNERAEEIGRLLGYMIENPFKFQ